MIKCILPDLVDFDHSHAVGKKQWGNSASMEAIRAGGTCSLCPRLKPTPAQMKDLGTRLSGGHMRKPTYVSVFFFSIGMCEECM